MFNFITINPIQFPFLTSTSSSQKAENTSNTMFRTYNTILKHEKA